MATVHDDADRVDAPKKQRYGLVTLFGTICNAVFGVDPTDTESTRYPESPLTDFDHDSWGDFTKTRLTSAILYQVAFLGMLIYFIVQSYIEGRTKSFISLDDSAGVCRSDSKSKTCCEVPQTVTGTFLADTKGHWNTGNNFSYINNNYAVTVAGLEYTNDQWTAVMKNITAQLEIIGTKGENRDLSWNMIAWTSFTAQNLDRGFLQFYATGKSSLMFNKPIVNSGVASAASQTKTCNQAMDLSYSASTSDLDISIELCDDASGQCENPCPNILAPQAMGYDPYTAQGTSLDVQINMQAVSTALAVNLGMVSLNHLVMVPADSSRTSLLSDMVNQGAIDQTTADHTSSYFDTLHAPTRPIYCHSANKPVPDSNTWVSGDAFCMVRIGNTLAYPVTTSYGWSKDGTSYPTQCTKREASVDGSAAKFYCNRFDINVGFIYYPVPNQNITDTYTYRPTRSPTQRPSPPPGAPTMTPTRVPSTRPTTSPTRAPTPPPWAPSAAPTTISPSRKPVVPPTAKPTNLPTTKPSMPTVNPTRAPTNGARRLLRGGRETTTAQASRLERTLQMTQLAASDPPTTEPSPAPTTEPTESGDDDDYDDDGGAGGEEYYYVGDGSYYDPSGGNGYGESDDFAPLIPAVVDNGLIFGFGKVAASMMSASTNQPGAQATASTNQPGAQATASARSDNSNGDLFVPNLAYYAMVDTVVGTLKDKSRGFKKDFTALCSSSVHPSIAPGCAILAFNMDGDNRRDISEFYYQPSATPAYSNTLYVKSELLSLQKNTPTSLIQTYYSCVLAPWPAFLAAVGIGASSASVFVVVGFACYIFMAMFVLNRYFGANIPTKKEMEKSEQAAREAHDAEVATMLAVMNALRLDLASGKANLPHVAEVFNVKDQNEAADSKYAVVPTTESHGAVNPRTVAPTDLQAELGDI